MFDTKSLSQLIGEVPIVTGNLSVSSLSLNLKIWPYTATILSYVVDIHMTVFAITARWKGKCPCAFSGKDAGMPCQCL
jgi:hypothetical protein